MNSLKKYTVIFSLGLFLISGCEKENTVPGTSTNTKNIPIIFHVIHNGEPVGTYPNISHTIIENELSYLNENFKKNNINVMFILAEKSPSGSTLAETGVERIYRPETSFVSLDFFQAGWAFQSMWNPNEYVNVWTAKTSDYTSRGTMPYVPNDYPLAGLIATDYYKDNPPNYVEGILFLTPGGSYAGTSLTHETGHFLGLIHPYEDACAGTDYCNDTFQYDKKSGTNFDANGYTTDCAGVKFIEKNFMGWTLSTVTEFVFSQDQVSRMEHALRHAYHRPGSLSAGMRISVNNYSEDIPEPSLSLSLLPQTNGFRFCFPTS